MFSSRSPDSSVSRWRSGLPWLAALLPALFLAFHISLNQVNTLFMDDWHCVEMLEKHANGTVTAHDYFAGYLEHRPVMMRALYVVGMTLFHGDLRAIQWVGFILQLLTVLCVALMARKMMGPKQAALPVALAGLCFFSPLMWQGWLWGGMTIYYFPPAFLAIGLWCLGKEAWPILGRWAIAMSCGILAVYSLGPGFPVLAILGATAWWLDAHPRPGWKPKVLGAAFWLVVILAVVGIYFHDLRNEVHPDHAYGMGEEKTVERGIDALKREPLVAIKFALAVIGGSMIRGPLVDPGVWAAPLGGLVVVLVATLGWLLWKTRNEPGRAAMAGIYAFCLYGISSALLVSMGRAWLVKGGSISPALNIRYISVGAYTWAALILFACWMFQRWKNRVPAGVPGFLLGVYLVWQSALWLYGVQMMGEWKAARTRGAAALHFLNVAVAPGHELSEPSYPALKKWSATLDRMGYLERPMLTSPKLGQFKAGKPISPRNAGLTQVFRNAVGEVTVNGYGLHNSSIAPDAILLARRPEGSQEWEVFHVVTYDLPSLRQARAMMTDQTFINYVANLKAGRNPNFSRWSAVLASKELPEGRWELSAWGYDYTKNRIHPIAGIFLWEKSPVDLRIIRISEKEVPKME